MLEEMALGKTTEFFAEIDMDAEICLLKHLKQCGAVFPHTALH